MVDSRAKGRAAELKCRDELRKLTGLGWERTPFSGALDAKHKLKGDLYVPGKILKYCVEVKHYKDEHLNSKLITGKNPQILQWWEQTVREAKEMDSRPLLVFKHNRSKWFAMYRDVDIFLEMESLGYKFLTLYPEELNICLLTDFCAVEEFTE